MADYQKKILVDCKNLAEYSSGIKVYFIPYLLSAIEEFSQFKFILVAHKEFDTGFINQFSNWEFLKIPQKKSGIFVIDFLYYNLWTYPSNLNKIDANLLITPYYDFIIPPLFKDKAIITVHDLCYWEFGNLYTFKVRNFHKLILWYNLLMVKNIITVSKTSLEMLVKVFGNNILSKSSILYNTFEPQDVIHENLPNENKHKIILYTGGYEQRKNIDMLFMVVKELSFDWDIKLVFTGDYKDCIPLNEKIEFYKISKNVVLTGKITLEELTNYYLISDLVINISLCEGFGRSNLEAMIFKKPLVCSDIKVFRELVGDYPIYCDPNNLSSIKNSIVKSFGHKLSRNSSTSLDKYLIENNKYLFFNIIKNALDAS